MKYACKNCGGLLLWGAEEFYHCKDCDTEHNAELEELECYSCNGLLQRAEKAEAERDELQKNFDSIKNGAMYLAEKSQQENADLKAEVERLKAENHQDESCNICGSISGTYYVACDDCVTEHNRMKETVKQSHEALTMIWRVPDEAFEIADETLGRENK